MRKTYLITQDRFAGARLAYNQISGTAYKAAAEDRIQALNAGRNAWWIFFANLHERRSVLLAKPRSGISPARGA